MLGGVRKYIEEDSSYPGCGGASTWSIPQPTLSSQKDELNRKLKYLHLDEVLIVELEFKYPKAPFRVKNVLTKEGLWNGTDRHTTEAFIYGVYVTLRSLAKEITDSSSGNS